MKELWLFPPNFRDIQRAFDVRGKPIFFAYGSTIYNPTKTKIPPALVAHEQVHSMQQGWDPRGWWKRYIADIDFRYAQELPAHCAEYRHFCAHHAGEVRERYLHKVAVRLSSALYQRMTDYGAARADIEAACQGISAAPAI